MKSIYVRNYLVFISLVILFVGWLVFTIVKQLNSVQDSKQWITHTYDTISLDLGLIARINGLLAAQRAYLITENKFFLEKYDEHRARIKEIEGLILANVQSDPVQLERTIEIGKNLSQLLDLVDRHIIETAESTRNELLLDVEEIETLRSTISDLNREFLELERNNLERRGLEIDKTNETFLLIFLIGGASFALILLFFNSYILKSQLARLSAMNQLERTKERLDLAFEGMNDGIFDWDISNNNLFISQRYRRMLGYNSSNIIPTIEFMSSLIHPDDRDTHWKIVDDYLAGLSSELSTVLRMQHKEGHYIWVNVRGKAQFDENGKAVRLAGSVRDITEMREIEASLIDATQKAEKANEAKSEFLAHMSHEIRTPLTAIAGIAEILEKQSSNLDKMQKKMIATLLKSTSSLKDLINDVLDFSKIEAGEIVIESEDFNLVDMLKDTEDLMVAKAHEKDLAFSVDYSALKQHMVKGDEGHIRQILINLLGNAIKFTSEGSVLLIVRTVSTKGRTKLIFEVEDTGMGISKKDQKTIFSRFKQGDSTISRKYGGTGLGLPISRSLAELMGGTLHVSSQPGKGSTFTLSLYVDENSDGDFGVSHANGNKAAEGIKDKFTDKNYKALIVEDYAGNVVVVGHMLKSININFDHAENGKKALEMFNKKNYDFILMDIQMPEMDGIQATISMRDLEEKEELVKTPIMGMTAHAMTTEKEKCFHVGMDEFITKPINENEFYQKIGRLVDKEKTA
mgnify:CR=1 FL=1